MGAISRINKSSLNQRTKTQLRKALTENSTIKYVTADVTLAQSATTHAAVTGLSIPVKSGKIYKWDVWVYSTADSGDGVQISLTGSATAGFVYGQWVADGATAATPTSTYVSAITTESDATEGTAAAVLITGTGTYSPSVDGYFKLAAGQAVSGATDTVIKKGSYLQLTEVNN